MVWFVHPALAPCLLKALNGVIGVQTAAKLPVLRLSWNISQHADPYGPFVWTCAQVAAHNAQPASPPGQEVEPQRELRRSGRRVSAPSRLERTHTDAAELRTAREREVEFSGEAAEDSGGDGEGLEVTAADAVTAPQIAAHSAKRKVCMIRKALTRHAVTATLLVSASRAL